MSTVSCPAGGSLVGRGARTHNLKNLDVTLPHDKLGVFTGVSGSWKSSLAFGALHAEVNRWPRSRAPTK